MQLKSPLALAGPAALVAGVSLAVASQLPLSVLRKKFRMQVADPSVPGLKPAVGYWGILTFTISAHVMTVRRSLLAGLFSLVFTVVGSRMSAAAVTGGVGAGKTTVCQLLQQNYDYAVVDMNEVTRSLLSKDHLFGLSQWWICSVVGKDIVDPESGEIITDVLMERLSADPELQMKFSNISAWCTIATVIKDILVHRLCEWRQNVVVDVPPQMIHDSSLLRAVCSPIIVVEAPLQSRFHRLLTRDPSSTEEEIELRIKVNDDLVSGTPLSGFQVENSGAQSLLADKIHELVTQPTGAVGATICGRLDY